MKKITDLIKSLGKFKTILIIVVLLVSTIMLILKCKQEITNPLVIDVIKNPQQTKTLQLNDSTKYTLQTTLLAETQKQVQYLQSALQIEMFRKIKINKTQTSIEFRDSIVYVNIPGNSEKKNDSTIKTTSIYPLHFKHKSEYLEESYTVLSEDSSLINSLKISNKQHIIIGDVGKWYQKKSLKVGIMNENPYIIIDSLQSVVYKEKSKLEITAGPILIFNQKSTSFGAGITFKKNWFSATVGYKIF